ncbi:MAG: ABC transporter ATP-binding protein [Pseudomonadota bacterium]
MLNIEGLAGGYGDSQVLFDVSFEIGAKEVVTLIGRNGMGKTTTIKTLFGLLAATGGRVTFDGADLTNARPHQIAKAGLGLVPEGRQIFPTLTVEENLVATARPASGSKSTLSGVPTARAWELGGVYELFPQLAERRKNLGSQLSGGEQQMLAIGRALMTNPTLLVLDEATEGLAPLVRETIWSCLSAIRETGIAILVIDKNIQRLADIADRHVIIEKGRTVWEGDSQELLATSAVVERYLHI